MLDSEGRPCFGPSDLGKCADCIESVNVKKLKFLARIENTTPELLDVLVRMKKRMFKTGGGVTHGPNGNLRMSDTRKKELQDGLRKRLEYAIRLMNHHVVTNICVSSDVKRTMARFGVMENKLLVQPVGSILAASQRRDIHALHTPLVIREHRGRRAL